jgi:hypothetical protein
MVLLKCEFFNPLGSVKDRIGMAMIHGCRATRHPQKEFCDLLKPRATTPELPWPSSPPPKATSSS